MNLAFRQKSITPVLVTRKRGNERAREGVPFKGGALMSRFAWGTRSLNISAIIAHYWCSRGGKGEELEEINRAGFQRSATRALATGARGSRFHARFFIASPHLGLPSHFLTRACTWYSSRGSRFPSFLTSFRVRAVGLWGSTVLERFFQKKITVDILRRRSL